MAADWTTGRVRYYKCDETTGALVDEEGNGNLTVNGLTYGEARSDLPKFGTGVKHTADGQDANSGGSCAFGASTGKATFACWVKASAAPIVWLINTRAASTGAWSFLLYSNGNLYPYWGTGQQNPGISVAALYDGNWHHLAVTFDGAVPESTVFIDGAEITGSPYALTAAAAFSGTDPLRLFEPVIAGSYLGTISIDEVMIFNNRILTDEDIAGLAAWDGSVTAGLFQQTLVPS